MWEILKEILTNQNIVQGGGILMALACILVIYMLLSAKSKQDSKNSDNHEGRLLSLTEQSNKTIERNTEAHLQTAKALAQHDVILGHLIQVLERKL